MLKIYLTGPESTGKTSLAKSLSAHFGCPWVPEYARQYVAEQGGKYTMDDLKIISKGQLDWNRSFEQAAPEMLVLDTGQAVLHVWSEDKYAQVDPIIVAALHKQKGALHILCSPDIDWEPDPLREHPDERRELFEKYESLLQKYQLDYAILAGKGEERVDSAIQLVEKYCS